ncbi:hypothetical protein BS78_K109200 [Paspalum vaginatum]|uniref:Uncharacterized protein n=1 Tax=Paspalum vaginatum TaxID=158149 RepID=A0A9W7XFD7_9POAL|nr:hypothetical protein BS78_K109200 [Paspalum vaginatum]
MEKDDNLLRSIGYFWLDSLNCFLFGAGPMTPTLMDVVMILGLDVHSSCPSPFSLTECPHKKIHHDHSVCLLPVSMSTSNRINKPGYESYQPVLAARQFGLNQTSPRLIIHEKIQSRAELTDSLVASKAYTIFFDLRLQVPDNLEFVYTSDGFNSWWGYWRSHLFQGVFASALVAIDPEYHFGIDSFSSFIILESDRVFFAQL